MKSFPYLEHTIMWCTNNELMFVRHNGQVSHKVYMGVAVGGVCGGIQPTLRGGGCGRRICWLSSWSPNLFENVNSFDDFRPVGEEEGVWEGGKESVWEGGKESVWEGGRGGGRDGEREREREREREMKGRGREGGREGGRERETIAMPATSLTHNPTLRSLNTASVVWRSCSGRGHWGSRVSWNGRFLLWALRVSCLSHTDSDRVHSRADDATQVYTMESN